MHINNFKDLNFNFIEMKNALVDVGIIDSAIYFDKKANKLFVYLEIEDYEKYVLISKINQNLWWSNLSPLDNIAENENPLYYAWHDVFCIKDKN